MKEAIRDLVLRMTGGNAMVADICASTVADVEEGDVCQRLNAEKVKVLAAEPSVVQFVDINAEVECGETPFVVCGDLLYTRRNWRYEQIVRRRIGAMASEEWLADVTVPLDGEFASLREKDQRPAVPKLLSNKFSILTGGPGTGKTFTLGKAVKLVRERNPEAVIALAAPTAKAAARINESLEDLKRQGLLDGVQPASTLHSLLRSNPDFVTFKHNKSNPLPLDWLVVDEASMIDLPLMAKLLDALPPTCSLTLIGDVHQLASVERGRVFGDLCAMFRQNVAALTESARFPPGGTIDRLARAVNSGEAGYHAAMEVLAEGKEASYQDISGGNAFSPTSWGDFEATIMRGFESFANCTDPKTAIEKLPVFRILCALRHGPYGVERINEYVSKHLGKKCPQPVMITQNDKTLDVHNGDVGVVMPVEQNGGQYLYLLPSHDGIRKIRRELLPETELAFATTIHKAQGSEFDDVAIVLPPDGENPLLTREILYTGITRTKGNVHIYAGDASIQSCCQKSVERMTGLAACQ